METDRRATCQQILAICPYNLFGTFSQQGMPEWLVFSGWRGLFPISAETSRLPNQPERRAEKRRQHQRERHRNDVERLVAPAGRT